MKCINTTELSALLKSGADIQLVDVREPAEHHEFNIGGKLIPLSEIMRRMDLVDRHRPVIVYCRKGIRSQFAIQRLQSKEPFTNLVNLTGGLDAWKMQFPV